MEFVRDLNCLRARHRGGVVTLGTFDGIHRGHQALIVEACTRAAARSCPAVMATFEPMPREYLHPEAPPPRLANFRERWRLLETSGLDLLCVMRFDERLRNLSGEAFVAMLATDLRATAVIVGHDFKFGRDGAATAAGLRAAGLRLGFDVHVVPPVQVDGERVSSTGVRAALAASDFAKAARYLGRPYTMRGRVFEGEKLGRTLGFPTANVRLKRAKSPLGGIFAVRVLGLGPSALPGVASLGTRPTVGGVEPWLETHVFDFAADLYGREIEVEFVAKIRDEERFDDLDALVTQMHRDAAEARRVLAA